MVYGHPAVAVPLSRGVLAATEPAPRCQLVTPKGLTRDQARLLQVAFGRAAAVCGRPKIRLRLTSALPVSAGLGSSAAVSVAIARALLAAARPSPPGGEVLRVAMAMERAFHGTPSGIDAACAASGEVIRFVRRPSTAVGTYRAVHSPKPLRLVVAWVGQRKPTRDTVAALRERMGRWPTRYRRAFRDIGLLADEGARAIAAGDAEGLGDAMNFNHGLLCALGLSSAGLDSLVHRLRALGAQGAKLTGAGGAGGAVIGLFPEPGRALAALRSEGVNCFSSPIAGARR